MKSSLLALGTALILWTWPIETAEESCLNWVTFIEGIRNAGYFSFKKIKKLNLASTVSTCTEEVMSGVLK